MAVNFNYISRGNPGNKAIIFLHGFMGCADDWLKIMGHFKHDYHCIAFDLPGHGSTKVTGGSDDYTMEGTADELKNFFTEKNLKNIILCGYSMGGRLAINFAMKYPEIIDKLILESAAPGIIDEQERAERLCSDELLSERILNSDYEVFIDSWYSMPLFSGIKKHPEYTKILERRMKNDKQELARSLRMMSTGRMQPQWNNLKNSTIPALLIAGELDEKYIGINKRILEVCPGAYLRVIPDAGHNCHFEKPEIFVNYIRELLEK